MNTSTDTVRWGMGMLAFELGSPEPRMLAKAAALFRPWVCADDAAPFRRWWVEPVTGASLPEAQWGIWDGGSDAVYRGSAEGVLAMVEHLALVALRDHVEGWPDLHGAVVCSRGRGLVIVGAGESGKSTLACALWQSGWSLLGDDVTLIESARRLTHPIPRRISLRHASRPLFPESLVARILATPSCAVTGESCVFHPDEVDHRERPVCASIDALFFLGRAGAARGPSLLQPLQPAQALLAMLPYSSRSRGLGLGGTLQVFKPLAEAVPAYDLFRDSLHEMVAAVEGVVPRIG